MTATVACAESAPTAATTPTRKRWTVAEVEALFALPFNDMLFRAQPKTELSKFICAYKSASSRLLKKEFPEIRCKLWKEYFWSRSFCLLTTGGAPIDVIHRYIESQGRK